MIEVRNRQRRRVNTRQLKRLAEAAWSRGRARTRTRRSASIQLSIALVSDREMAELNFRYHHVAAATDVLTFDYGDGQAEIIVSVDHAYANARRYRTTPGRELALYIAHGILHLHGHDDRTPRQRARMKAAERKLLARLRAR